MLQAILDSLPPQYIFLAVSVALSVGIPAFFLTRMVRNLADPVKEAATQAKQANAAVNNVEEGSPRLVEMVGKMFDMMERREERSARYTEKLDARLDRLTESVSFIRADVGEVKLSVGDQDRRIVELRARQDKVERDVAFLEESIEEAQA